MKLSKTEEILSLIKSYVIPILVALFGLGAVWAGLNNRMVNMAEAIDHVVIEHENLEEDTETTRERQEVIMQQLSAIDVKIDYIIKALDAD